MFKRIGVNFKIQKFFDNFYQNSAIFLSQFTLLFSYRINRFGLYNENVIT